jgi:tetratricopeptide (TPR) repeat protein
MVNPRFLSRLLTDGLLLVLAGCLALPFELNAQVHPTPQQSGQGANPQPAAQAQLDKLEDARKAAHAAGDAKVEAKTLGQIGDLYFGVPDFQKAMGFYNGALALARSANDEVEQAAALLGIARCYRFQAQSQKALETFQQALDLATASADESDQTAALVAMGNVNYDLGDKQKRWSITTRLCRWNEKQATIVMRRWRCRASRSPTSVSGKGGGRSSISTRS